MKTLQNFISSPLTVNSLQIIEKEINISTPQKFKYPSAIKKYFIFFIILMLSIAGILNGQTTKTVGAAGDYARLKLAFDAINAGTITGAITLQIIANTTETASAVLNASGSGSANYTSVTIYPTLTGLTISGNLGAPLIDLNGADNVTFDGRVNATGSTKDLIITNSNTANTSSTFRFILTAENNTVKYCKIKGSETSNTKGIIFFSTAAAGNGNDGNTITNNDISCNAAARPRHTIYSAGSAGFENSGNTISNNNIFDYIRAANTSNGISLAGSTTDWTITGNSFYETTSFAASSTAIYTAIRINNTSGNNFIISNNFIGGSSASCGGAAWTKTNTRDNIFYGIYLNVGTTTASSVQNNTIKNFAWSNSAAAEWAGLYINGGNVNIGTTTGNTIGASTGTGSITVTGGATATNVYGINILSTGIVVCSNNSIGSITVANSTATLASNFFGIARTGGTGTTTISNNNIGSTATANSIRSSSASTANAQNVYGISNTRNSSFTVSNNTIDNLTNSTSNTTAATTGLINGISSTTGTNSISNNTIRNLTIANANNTTTNTASVCGIALIGATLKTLTGNTIYNLSNTYVSFAGNVTGIYFTASTGANVVSNNFIHSLSVTGASSTAASIYGIKISSGAATYSNNIISLGGNTATTIYGIYETGAASNNNNLYFNTIYIGGNLLAGVTNKSYALYSAVTTNTRNFRNNIFNNSRSTVSGASLHYAAYFNYAVSTSLTLDYNDYYSPGTGGVLGFYNGANVTTVPLITGLDALSFSAIPSFTNAGSTVATDYKPLSDTLAGNTIATFTTDYSGTTRSESPTMGAIETTLNLNVDVYKAGLFVCTFPRLKDAFDKINNGTYIGALELRIKKKTTENVSAIIYQSGYTGAGGTSNYSSVNIYPTVTGITISSNLNTPTIEFNGADNITLDGRVNATGSSNSLTILNSNTGAAASTIRFINTAENNVVKYCTINGSGNSATNGTIIYSTATTGNGNDGNTISNNNITSNAAGRTLNAIYSSGSVGFENSGNTISNNNIFNFINAGIASYGIHIFSNSTAFTITGNSFYETSPSFVPTASVEYDAIRLNNVSGINFIVNDNYIGGSAALCGGSAWTKTNAFNNLFYGIYINVGTGTVSSFQNNTIKNIVWGNSGSASWNGIHILAGAANIGTVTGNTIGSSTGTGSITITGGATGVNVYGINIATTGTVDCQNNSIGSITTDNTNNTFASNFYGINKSSTAGTTTIRNNTIGSSATANSILANSISTANAQGLIGIISAGTGTINIYGNTIVNLTNAYTGTLTSQTHGISTSAGSNTIQNNTIHNISTVSGQVGTNASASLIGISQTASSGGTTQTVTGNTIYGLSNNTPTARIDVYGIYYAGPTAGTHSVSENFVHSLNILSSNISSNIKGIELFNGLTTCANNIINLGVGISTGFLIDGIRDESGATNNNNIYFNSVYLGGSVSGTTSNTAALLNVANTSTRNYRNNILVNERSGGATGKHYAIILSGLTGVTINYNDYYVTGTGGTLGMIGAIDKADLASWALGTSQDANSLSIDPGFTIPGGTSPFNYYISSTLPGVAGTGITTDFSGISRGVTPKMGALEANNYQWEGSISSVYSNVANWTSAAVPSSGADITFVTNPFNNCVLDTNIIIRNIINAQSTDKLVLNGKQLILKGVLTFSNGAQIDATADSSEIIYQGLLAQNTNSADFVSNTVNRLNINNSLGLTQTGNLTITKALTLTDGNFTIGANTLTLNGSIDTSGGTLTGGTSSNIIISGSDTTAILPAIVLNNLTVNRADGLHLIGNASVAGTLALTDGTITLGSDTLTLSGNSPTRTTGNIDASITNSTLLFTNTAAITLPASVFTGNVNNLTINGTGGVTSSGDFTLVGILDLQSANPLPTKGSLNMWDGLAFKTLNMGEDATTIGLGDVTGIVSRTSTFVANKTYTFGNSLTSIIFDPGGIFPTQIQSKTIIGAAPSWKAIAIKRVNDFNQTGGSGCTLTLTTSYLDTELNGNTENTLVSWKLTPPVTVNEIGRTGHNATNNWLSIENINISELPGIFGSERTLSNTEIAALQWNGSVSNNWVTPANWTPNSAPSDLSNIIIPDATTTPNDPILPDTTEVKTLNLKIAGILNSVATEQLTINGSSDAWKNEGGTFNPGNSKVIFTGTAATISGSTNFYDVTIDLGFTLSINTGSTMGIAGNITNNGTWDILTGAPNTVIYNGTAAQSLAYPSTTTFSNLTIDNTVGATLTSDFLTTVSGVLTINNGKIFIIDAGKNLTVNDTIINNAGTSGLVIKSTATGTGSLIYSKTGVSATAERYMVKDTWHNISSPVSGQDIPLFLNNASNNIPTSGANYGMMYYSESGGAWTYFTGATVGNLLNGNGYLVRHTVDNAVSFYGTLISTSTDVNISQLGNGWNSIGNPFPCSIGVREDAISTDNFLTYNAASFDPSFAVLYVWDEPAVRVKGVSYYKVIGNAGFTSSKPVLDQAYMQPGQGFLVKSVTGGSIMSFTESMKIHENTDSNFKAPRAPWPGINLNISSGTKSASTAITFHENMTRGLDITYDAGLLGGDPTFKLYSRLVEDNGINFMLQCLPDNNFDSLTIPLGLDFIAGGDVTFSADIFDLPFGFEVILEDRLLGKFTNLEVLPSYSVTIDTNTSGIGRFFLHSSITPVKPTSITSINKSTLTIYSNEKQIIIKGLVTGKTTAKLYDITGHLIKSYELTPTDINVLSASDITNGIYILKIMGKNLNENKKLEL